MDDVTRAPCARKDVGATRDVLATAHTCGTLPARMPSCGHLLSVPLRTRDTHNDVLRWSRNVLSANTTSRVGETRRVSLSSDSLKANSMPYEMCVWALEYQVGTHRLDQPLPAAFLRRMSLTLGTKLACADTRGRGQKHRKTSSHLVQTVAQRSPFLRV